MIIRRKTVETIVKIIFDDVLDLIETITETIQGFGFDDFRTNRRVKISVAGNLENILELLERLPNDFKEIHPDTLWNDVDEFRSRILQGNFSMDEKEVWHIAKVKLNKVEKMIKTLH